MASRVWIIGESPNRDPQSVVEAFPMGCASRDRAHGLGVTEVVFKASTKVNISPGNEAHSLNFASRSAKAREYWRQAGMSGATLLIVFGCKARNAFRYSFGQAFEVGRFYEMRHAITRKKLKIWFLPHPSPRNILINPDAFARAGTDALAALNDTKIAPDRLPDFD